MSQKRFTLRVYGLLLNDRQEVLLSDECRFGKSFTKFPGGGMEFGESFQETVIREFQEEIGVSIEVGELFYFNEFCQISAFNPSDQLYSFYYFVHCSNWDSIPVNTHTVPLTSEGEKHRWIPIKDLHEELLTFPIDKLVATKLRLEKW